jgi:hypothetical protein
MAKKNAAAVELGRLGGKVRVPKGFGVLSEEERAAAARRGALARWAKKREAEAAAKPTKKEAPAAKKAGK